MSRHYLNVPFREKDQAKRLGARFDWEQKRWFVQGGADLTLFAAWLPTDDAAPGPDSDARLDAGLATTHPAPPGIPLSQLLRSVSVAVAQICSPQGVWTLVEVMDVKMRGHVYLEVSERDDTGLPVASARAIIWQSSASRILPEFEQLAGVKVQAGIKLLVRARPEFHIQYGFSLQIDAIDAQYTLGQFEARRREIRARLQREGLFEKNRSLPAPWDYRIVLVLAPVQGAGLGDFRAEAQRLEAFGICRFIYASSRFQGEGAAAEILTALGQALDRMDTAPDAVVIIRGGGAVGDLAWLDDYDLVRSVCLLPIPVLTGIGHERDHVLLDEVAQTRFDTPSKVIAGIEQRIRLRTDEAMAAMAGIFQSAQARTQQVAAQTTQHMIQIRADAHRQVQAAGSRCNQLSRRVGHEAAKTVQSARIHAQNLLDETRHDAQRHLVVARQAVPALWLQGQERMGALLGLARVRSRGLVREILGQGPEKTLTRGFAIVRSARGTPIMRVAEARDEPTLDLQFKDGILPVKPT
ncbi:exodeoxyribonuclease VII large subunit [Castellaniella sp.]|uniref:exodeoxyribonuclease VII large subunit n=1 Tax=Castellaniella sp. TaxID=1955812 RepID=UPI00356A2918